MNSQKDTLLILSPGFAKNEADTSCLPFQQVFLRSVREAYPLLDIQVISFQYPYEEGSYQWHGINVTSFAGKNKGGLKRRLLWRRINKYLKQLIADKKVIGIMSFWYGECALLAKRLSEHSRIRHLCWIPGQDAKKENKYARRIQSAPEELVGLSDFIVEEFERNHGTRPAHMITPGIDSSLFDDNLPLKDIDILGAGSLIPLKQYDLFLEIIGEIKKSIPSIKAAIAGEGPEKEKLKQMITRLGLRDNVILTGELPHAEVLRLMQRSTLFLHPSSYEGFGVVCIEALYAGCRVLSFSRPMKEEIKNWCIATSKEDMIEKAVNLIQQKHPAERVLYKSADTAAREFMKLYGI